MKERLELLSRDPARSQYILMRRFTPPIVKNKFIKNGVLSEEIDTVTEVFIICVMYFIHQIERYKLLNVFLYIREVIYEPFYF